MTASTEIATMFASFEDRCFKHKGTDAWMARDLEGLLGYDKWEKFRGAIKRAWESCAASGVDATTNFLRGDGSDAPWDPEKIFPGAGKDKRRGPAPEDAILTRRAAYLVALNGDPRKPAIAFAQQYFVVSTRKLEVIEQRIAEATRMQAREKLSEAESKFQGVLYANEVDGPGIGRIRSKGDEILFDGMNTEDMKEEWDVPTSRPLFDFAPEVVVVAKQFATAITTHNVKARKLKGEDDITDEHLSNNQMVRDGLGERGIVPKDLDPEEDIKKVQRRHASEAKELTKGKKSPKKPDGRTPSKPKSAGRKKKPTADAMRAWFYENHQPTGDRSPYVDGEYLHPTVDVADALSQEFPNADDATLAAVTEELDAENVWTSAAWLDEMDEESRLDGLRDEPRA